MQVVKFNGQPLLPQLGNFLPKYTTDYNDAMYSYACNMLLAGKYNKPREITVEDDAGEHTYYPDENTAVATKDLLSYRILPGNVGYIRINDCLWNYNLIPEFDKVLDSLFHTKAIILDLSETPSGGNTTVARAIMSRFITKELPYQKHVLMEKEYGTIRSWIEYVLPRNPTYKNKVIVMVGHWTGSMGEGIAIGFDAMKRAKITGTKMAGLLGAVYTGRTPATTIGYNIPAEKMYHVNGTPREDFVPEYLTNDSKSTYKKALELADVK